MLPRFHVGEAVPLSAGTVCALPDGASRHVQVLRMQPGQPLQVFDGQGREWLARVVEMARKSVSVELETPVAVDRELPVDVVLAIGMPANDRMDALVEKATELGVAAIQPLVCERSVLRLEGERAAKKVAHWQAVAVSACEQSGRAVVPRVHEVRSLQQWLRGGSSAVLPRPERKAVLSLRDARPLKAWIDAAAQGHGHGHRHGSSEDATGEPAMKPRYVFLSGPEGGLAPAEEEAAVAAGWAAVTLGARVLRADTAPLAALSVIGAICEA